MSRPVCRACGTPVPFDPPIPRDAECATCRRDLRVCTNCRHYDTHFKDSCRETEADPVADKERRNFCEYFELSGEPFARGTASPSRESQARAKLDALFGGSKPAADRASDARRKLDDLFRKPSPGDDDA